MKYSSRKYAKLARTIKRYDIEKGYVIALDEYYNVTAMGVIATGNECCCAISFEYIHDFLIKNESNKFIFIHNHPGCNSHPSSDDDEMTDFLKEKSLFFNYEFIDHIIISSCNKRYFSYRDYDWNKFGGSNIKLPLDDKKVKSRKLYLSKYKDYIKRVQNLNKQFFFLLGLDKDNQVSGFVPSNKGDFYDIDIDTDKVNTLSSLCQFNRLVLIYNHPKCPSWEFKITDYDVKIYEHIKACCEEEGRELVDVIITDENKNLFSFKQNGYDMGKTIVELVNEISIDNATQVASR